MRAYAELTPAAGLSPEPAARRPLILHISADYPDPVRNRTTPAVKNFIDQLDDCDHVIVSLKRRNRPADCYLHRCDAPQGQMLFAMGYWALPGGLFHRAAMARVAREIEKLVAKLAFKPDLIVAHKLTVEGVIAHRLQRTLRLPYICCVRGEAEDKFFRFKPELGVLFGEVIAGAEALLYVSAWFRKRIEERYPGLTRRHGLLPNFPPPTIGPGTTACDTRALVSVLDLNMYRRKGFDDLIAAFARALRRIPELRLDVIGWCEPATMKRIRKLVAQAGVAPHVRFLGVLSHREVLQAIPHYAALVLPARNETFGMVYVEALLSGVPILYTAGSGIDGYVDGLDVGVKVRAGDVGAIADGLCTLARNARHYWASLLRDHAALSERFAPPVYLSEFRQLLAAIRERSERASPA